MTSIPNNDKAIAAPTKSFFVSMLTRDISLEDAILDLLDNCLDGALRSTDGAEVKYDQFTVSINLSKNEFIISDNCGGIPRDIAKAYAFKMGREEDDTRDSESETIGMYGIGMKRAIFKMGKNSTVLTSHKNDQFKVEITPDWLNEKDWNELPITNLSEAEKLDYSGTLIKVDQLYSGMANRFENQAFINDLNRSIGEHFSNFIRKGLTINVNDEKVHPILVQVLTSEDSDAPAPYIWKKELEGVTISIIVGLNTSRRLSDDEDDFDFERARSSNTAGWTIFCNDRAVIVGDKSRLTCWGDGIPMYHAQFSVITGIVEFKSTSADKLPITTTKRALDTSSDIWLEARTKMRDGLRVWINYTNQWKNNPRSDQTKYWESSKPMSINAAIDVISKRDTTTKIDGSIEYNPKKKKVLPEPETNKPSSKRITYSKPFEQVKEVSNFLFDRDSESPAIVGDKSFEYVLSKARQEQGEEK